MLQALVLSFLVSLSPSRIVVTTITKGDCLPSVEYIETYHNTSNVYVNSDYTNNCSGNYVRWTTYVNISNQEAVNFYVDGTFIGSYQSNERVWIPIY